MVEFYSNLDLPYQEIFIRKIYKLFSRKDVKLIMHESPKHKKIWFFVDFCNRVLKLILDTGITLSQNPACSLFWEIRCKCNFT